MTSCTHSDHLVAEEHRRCKDILDSLPPMNTGPAQSKFDLTYWIPMLDCIADEVNVPKLWRFLTKGVSLDTAWEKSPVIRVWRQGSRTMRQSVAADHMIFKGLGVGRFSGPHRSPPPGTSLCRTFTLTKLSATKRKDRFIWDLSFP